MLLPATCLFSSILLLISSAGSVQARAVVGLGPTSTSAASPYNALYNVKQRIKYDPLKHSEHIENMQNTRNNEEHKQQSNIIRYAPSKTVSTRADKFSSSTKVLGWLPWSSRIEGPNFEIEQKEAVSKLSTQSKNFEIHPPSDRQPEIEQKEEVSKLSTHSKNLEIHPPSDKQPVDEEHIENRQNTRPEEHKQQSNIIRYTPSKTVSTQSDKVSSSMLPTKTNIDDEALEWTPWSSRSERLEVDILSPEYRQPVDEKKGERYVDSRT